MMNTCSLSFLAVRLLVPDFFPPPATHAFILTTRPRSTARLRAENNYGRRASHCLPILYDILSRTSPQLTACASLQSAALVGDAVQNEADLIQPQIFPAGQPLDTNTFYSSDDTPPTVTSTISLLSWNILLPNSQDNWWCHKMYSPWVPTSARSWEHRQSLIRDRLLQSHADIICIQEADGETFEADFGFMKDAGYEHVLHNKFRFRCATFYKDTFELEQVGHKDRTLVTALRCIDEDNSADNDEQGRLIHIVNCHLSGGAAPERRLRQVHEAMEQIRKWKNAAVVALEKQRKTKRPSPKRIASAEETVRDFEEAGVVVCGDFNSDGNTGVRRLLVEGAVDPEWREQQYLTVQLTSKRREQPHAFVDAAELAYASNVCDGDYGEYHGAHGCRPATYVVPHLASLLLLPIDEKDIAGTRTEFGRQVAKSLADTLSLQQFCDNEIEQAFESVDLDGNGIVDEDEVQELLESVYTAIYGQQIEAEKRKFFGEFHKGSTIGLSREEFAEKLSALQRQWETRDSRADSELTKGLMDTLGMRSYCENELDAAFRAIDLNGNNLIDEDEIEALLQSVYLATYGKQIEEEKKKFFGRFHGGDVATTCGQEGELSLEQFTERLQALKQELQGGSIGSELVEIRTEADAQRTISRFSPILREALDYVFNKFSSSKEEGLSEDDVAKFLIKVNGQLGRGGTFRHTAAMFEKKKAASLPVALTRQDWYGVFARELSEGKWWQVVHDIEICGADLRSRVERDTRHYQGWLDYVYFDSQRLSCIGIQEALTSSEISHIYDKGDALPNEWHPSDHLPVAVVLSWR